MAEKPKGIDVPGDKKARWNSEITAFLTNSTPETFLYKYQNRKLYIDLKRAFGALDYRPSNVTMLVDIGVGRGGMLPAIRTAFSPTQYIGIDIHPEGFDEIRATFPSLRPEGSGSLQLVGGDATDPAVVGFSPKRKVDVIVSTHPNLLKMVKEQEDPVVNTGMVDIFANWMP